MIRTLLAQTSAALALSLAASSRGSVLTEPATVLHGCVRVPGPTGRMIGPASIVRSLTPAEAALPFRFSVTLRMRAFDELENRLGQGQRVAPSEMEEKYLPLKADYDRVAAWLASQGFTPTLTDRTHMTVFVTGPISSVSSALGVRFARVQAADGEYTSAVSEPMLPADLAPVVLSVDGLQPEFRMRHVRTRLLPDPADLTDGAIYITPDNIASAYSVPAGANGAGVTIAIIGEGPVNAVDLNTFWSTTGVPQTASNVTTINVGGGPGNPDDSLLFEAALDVEWAGAMAPAAKIRYYISQNALENLTQVSNDLPSNPSITVVSSSFGNTESSEGDGILREFSQTTASLAAAGVSVLDASGDAGSNPNGSISAGDYSASAPLGVTYPASDPNVTGVGGTTVTYTGNWQVESEVVWNQLSSDTPSASGGGVSGFFGKPSWQTGGSLLAGQNMRCVPDVAALSDAVLDKVNVGPGFLPANGTNVGVFLVYTSGGKQTEVAASGTSLSCPIWAGFTALINQARSAQGLNSIGLLNPHLYPLAGTAAFNDVTSGSNGFYSAGPGYDLCTGLGTPNMTNLIAGLAPSAQAPSRLANVSTRAEVETGDNILIAGFAVSGSAGSAKSVLVRGIGPGLQAFSISGALPQVVLGVYDSNQALIASDTGWGNAPVAGTSPVQATFRTATAADMAAVGAFALNSGSGDSAMVLTLPAGATYTVQISGVSSATGVALAEVYEFSTTVPELLSNVSSRVFVGTGAQIAIPGFVIDGTAPKTVLIRGIGPALANFGISGELAQTVLAIEDGSGKPIASDAGWGNALVPGTSTIPATYRQATAADMSSAGAFALPANSGDSAIVATLPPGNYTAELMGANGTTGTALVEVYQLSD